MEQSWNFLGKFRYSKKKSKKCSRCRRTCIFGDDEGIFQACRNYRKRKHINYKQYILHGIQRIELLEITIQLIRLQ